MNLKGGVIIIGSLYWDDSDIRDKWRKTTFLNLSTPLYTPIKIRYGRESSTRKNNYTMILSNHASTKGGKAMILEFKRPVKSFGTLEKLAYDLAEAEGIYKNPKPAKLNCTWGTVGLLLNPKLEKKDSESANILCKKWGELYSQYKNYVHTDYTISNKEKPVIDSNGISNIEWTKQMQGFDFLLVTATKPKPQKQITPRQIANRIIESGDGKYFLINRKHKITTFQDKEIIKLLKAGGFKTNTV